MARTLTIASIAGQTYYAFPSNQSLADWSTHRVAFAAGSSPNASRYTATVDDTASTVWFAFAGASQPAEWGDAIGEWDLSGATEANATANRAAVIAAVEGVIDHGDGTGEWGATNLGSGSTPWTEVIRTTDGTPIVGASVWITSDLAGTNVVAGTIVTISGGAFPSPFMLDSGETYYLWVSATGYNFPNPTSFTMP